MNTILRYLNNHRKISAGIFWLLLLVGRSIRLEPVILDRTRKLQESKPIEYGLGFVLWFILLKIGGRVPAYNIYNLVGKDEKETVDRLLSGKTEYRLKKQKYLLQSDSPQSEQFKSFVRDFLKIQFSLLNKNTALKPGKINKKNSFNALCYIDNILKNRGVKPFLVSGTLLGVIRDGDLIDGDNDLDIGVWASEANESTIFNILKEHDRFKTIYILPHMVQATDKSGTVIDIFIHYVEEDQVWHGTDVHRWYNSVFALKDIDFNGHIFQVPESCEKYLNENYGHWRSPVFFWDYSFDTPNQVFPQTRKAVFYLVERISKELSKKAPCRYQVQTALSDLNDRFGIDLTHFLGSGGKVKENNFEKNEFLFLDEFETLTIDHVQLINEITSGGSKLIVGISSDDMYEKNNKRRPILSQKDRHQIIEAIKGVSRVVIIEEEGQIEKRKNEYQ